MSDEYRKTRPEVDVWTEDDEFHRMNRTGITPPFYRDRAVYMLDGYAPDKQTYVYEGGYFWPSQEWRNANPPVVTCKTD